MAKIKVILEDDNGKQLGGEREDQQELREAVSAEPLQ
jgi:hypothetical protein